MFQVVQTHEPRRYYGAHEYICTVHIDRGRLANYMRHAHILGRRDSAFQVVAGNIVI